MQPVLLVTRRMFPAPKEKKIERAGRRREGWVLMLMRMRYRAVWCSQCCAGLAGAVMVVVRGSGPVQGRGGKMALYVCMYGWMDGCVCVYMCTSSYFFVEKVRE
jgi:hypothetical protein